MIKDITTDEPILEEIPEGETVPEETTEEVSTATPESPTEPKQENYRAKLNITNRFLEKEGYQFKAGKWNREAPKEQPEKKPDPSQGLTREEAIAYAKGFSDNEVEKAKKIATVEGITLTEAFSNDLFTSWKIVEDTKSKNAKAQLGASKGSGSTGIKTLQTSGLTQAEHKALAREKMGI